MAGVEGISAEAWTAIIAAFGALAAGAGNWFRTEYRTSANSERLEELMTRLDRLEEDHAKHRETVATTYAPRSEMQGLVIQLTQAIKEAVSEVKNTIKDGEAKTERAITKLSDRIDSFAKVR
jgi:uncharacterized protein (UPF0264 family)